MEFIARHIERLHLGIGDLDAFLVAARIARAFNVEASLCGWSDPDYTQM